MHFTHIAQMIRICIQKHVSLATARAFAFCENTKFRLFRSHAQKYRFNLQNRNAHLCVLSQSMRYTLAVLLFCLAGNQLFAQKYADLYSAGKYAKALKLAERAIESDNKDLSAYLTKAMCNIHLYLNPETHAEYPSGPSAAINIWQSIQKKDKSGQFTQAHIAQRDTILSEAYLLAEKWVEKKQMKRAYGLLEDMLLIQPAPAYYYLLGRMAEQEERHEEAVGYLNDAAAKIWMDARQGIAPEEKWSIIFADLADAVAEDDDFISAMMVYARGIRLFQNEEISSRCYTLLNDAARSWFYSTDTTFIMQVVQFLDTLPAGVTNPEQFHELKWACIYHQYAVSNEWSYYSSVFGSAQLRLLDFACADKKLSVLDTFILEMRNYTQLRIKAEGVSVQRKPELIQYWLMGYACMQQTSHEQAETAIWTMFEEALARQDFNWAGILLYNISASDMVQTPVKAAEKKLFSALSSLQRDALAQTDLYALSVMFPANTIGKQLQKDESKLLIAKYLDKKDYTNAAKKLRLQMQLDPNDPTLKSLYKKWLVEDYVAHFMNSATVMDLNAWTGSISDCKAGTLPDSVHDKVLDRLNYMRRLAGVPDNCVFSSTLNKKCMEAALMMHANYSLSHGPPKDWTCYTQEGAAAAGSSNLSLGYGGSEALYGQVEDDGGNNEAVGHRRWILYPDRRVFGHGSTPNAMALWALGSENSLQSQEIQEQYDDAYVAWPAAYYFPLNLTPYRWSLSRNGADFDETRIEMYCNNKRVQLDILPLAYGYGSATIVWVPDLSPFDLSKECTFKIVVKNIGVESTWNESTEKYDTLYEDYTYTVTLMPLF